MGNTKWTHEDIFYISMCICAVHIYMCVTVIINGHELRENWGVGRSSGRQNLRQKWYK